LDLEVLGLQGMEDFNAQWRSLRSVDVCWPLQRLGPCAADGLPIPATEHI
jgi:hypothetical protein